MMQVDKRIAGVVIAAAALAGCVGAMAPTVAVMPGPNKPFDHFAQDQAVCEQYADQQIAPLRQQANDQGFGTALLTTVLGAGLGAAIGGGHGAGIGAASGAVLGTAFGASNNQAAGYGIQQQYNLAYAQCMYARGNQVPGFSGNYGAVPQPGARVPPPLGY